MLRSYLKIAYRNILKNKGYSFINIFGLSLGIACCLLMFNYVRFEFSYDNFHPDLDRTYRVDQTMPGRAQDGIVGSTAPPLANALATNYPEIEETLRINTPGNYIIRYADRSDHVLAYYEDRVFAADSSFFSFFGFPLKEGDPRTALIGVNKVVISEEVAKKFFGDESALGKMLLLGDAQTAIEVTGVTTHQPENSHFHFDYLLSMETNPNVKKRDWSWVWTQVVTYIRLKPGADSKALEEKMAGFGEKVIRPAFESIGWDYDNGKTRKDDWKFYLRPMRDLHLKTGNNRIGRRYQVRVRLRSDRNFCFDHCRHQFYKPLDRAGYEAGKGSGCEKNAWGIAKRVDIAVSDRIDFACADIYCACPGPGRGTSAHDHKACRY
jgi:putative ABC transport system permease protein